MYIPEEYRYCRYLNKQSLLIAVFAVIILCTSLFGYFLLTQNVQAKCDGICIVPPSSLNDVHIYYGRVGQELNIRVPFKANPKTADGYWTFGNSSIVTGHDFPLYWQALQLWDDSIGTWRQLLLQTSIIQSSGNENYDFMAKIWIPNLSDVMIGMSSHLILKNENGQVKFRFTIRNISEEVLVVVLVVVCTIFVLAMGLLCANYRRIRLYFSCKKDALDLKDKTESSCENSGDSDKDLSAQSMLPLELDYDRIYIDWEDQFLSQGAPINEQEVRGLCCLQRRSCRKNCHICWKYFPIFNKGCLECCIDCLTKVVCGICGCCCEYINTDGSGQKPAKEMPRQTMSHEWDTRQAKNLKNLTVNIGDPGRTNK